MATISIPDQTKGLIFDLDGTLINSMPLHFKAYNHCLESWNVQYDHDTFLSRGGIPTRDTLLMIAEDHNIENFNVDQALKAKRKYVESNMDQLSLIDITFDIVKQHHGRLPLSVGTGSNKNTVIDMFKLFSLDQYIKHVVTASDVSHPKPHPETFLKCAELMNTPPEQCLVFEDGIPGIEAAKKAGMEVIDINSFL